MPDVSHNIITEQVIRERPAELTEHIIREKAASLTRTFGPNRAARALGVSRETALSLAAGAFVQPSTLALIREHLSRPCADSGGAVR